MRTVLLSLTAALFISCPPAIQAANLTKVERVIAKEPKYQSKPAYCLLVFGAEADFRVWLIFNGTTLYVDRNGSGDLTEPGKRVTPYYHEGQKFGFRPGKLGSPDGKVKYDLSQIRRHKEGHLDLSLSADGHGNKRHGYIRAGFDGPGPLRFADRAQDAPIIHFFGPLTLQRFEPQCGSVSAHLAPQPLVRGEENQLAFSLGTPGLGSGTFAKLHFSEQLTASAEIRFANGKTSTASLKPDE